MSKNKKILIIAPFIIFGIIIYVDKRVRRNGVMPQVIN